MPWKQAESSTLQTNPSASFSLLYYFLATFSYPMPLMAGQHEGVIDS